MDNRLCISMDVKRALMVMKGLEANGISVEWGEMGILFKPEDQEIIENYLRYVPTNRSVPHAPGRNFVEELSYNLDVGGRIEEEDNAKIVDSFNIIFELLKERGYSNLAEWLSERNQDERLYYICVDMLDYVDTLNLMAHDGYILMPQIYDIDEQFLLVEKEEQDNIVSLLELYGIMAEPYVD